MMKYLIPFVLAFSSLMAGCDHAGQINSAALFVDREAAATYQDIVDAIETGEVGDNALPKLQSALGHQANIRAGAKTIVKNVPAVQDKKSALEKVLELGFGSLLTLGACFLVVYLGAGAIVRPVFQAAGSWVSKLAVSHANSLQGSQVQ